MSGNSPVSNEKLDLRIRRTRDRLGDALIELVREKPFDEIKVQDVLERAEVGRSTFYAHFSGKEDLLWSDVDEFLAHMSRTLEREREPSPRLAPVRELFEHVGGQNELWAAFVRAGKLHEFLDLAQGQFARAIERRLRARGVRDDLRARSHAHAGALLALLCWWMREGQPGSPERMDELFHERPR
jgi:AcrR family transcriptional regulator